MKGELLENFAQQNYCFISSLRDAGTLMGYQHELLSMDLRQYSLEECNYSLSYIFGEDLSFQSYEEIEEYLRQHI